MEWQEDASFAKKYNLSFKVVRKMAPKAKWETVACDIYDLQQALTMAQGLDVYESGVIVWSSGFRGMIYWTSKYPNLFNTTVLELSIEPESS